MQIPLDKNLLINHFLSPIGRISEQCSITITKDSLKTLVSDNSDTIVFYCKITSPTGLKNNTSLNIKDVRKLTRVFEIIPHPIINVDIDAKQSVLKYKSPEISFKHHLVQDNVVRKPKLPFEQIKKLTFDITFKITGERLQDVLKGSSFAAETNKVYILQKDNKIYAEVTDRSIEDLDSITYVITDNITGGHITKPIPLNLEVLRLINATKPEEVIIKINSQHSVFAFSINTPQNEMLYIVPAMIK